VRGGKGGCRWGKARRETTIREGKGGFLEGNIEFIYEYKDTSND
jgi:hypothetical protein